MTTESDPLAGLPDKRPPPERTKSRVVIGLQMFLVPALIAGLGLGLYLLFQFMTAETMSLDQLVQKVSTSTDHQRAVYVDEFVKRLYQKRGDVRQPAPAEVRQVVPAIVDLLRKWPTESRSEVDQTVRCTLIRALGFIGDAAAAPYLEEVAEKDSDESARRCAMDSLGAIKSSSSLPVLKRILASPSVMDRKYAAFNLGALGDASVASDLIPLLSDVSHEVRWNAAVSLGYFLKNPAGVPVLKQMLDRGYLGEIVKSTDPRQEELKQEAVIMACRALGSLKEASVADILLKLSENDPSDRVRQAAREARSAIMKRE